MDRSLLLRAIAEVETGNNDSKVGRHGERSRYQIKPSAWTHMGYTRPFTDCRGPLADLCALQYLRWLDSSLMGTSPMEKDFREYALAWCWNGGLWSWEMPPRYLAHNVRIRLNNYATSVTNLYDSKDFRAKVAKEST